MTQSLPVVLDKNCVMAGNRVLSDEKSVHSIRIEAKLSTLPVCLLTGDGVVCFNECIFDLRVGFHLV